MLKIPAGTQSHHRFRLTGKGIKRIHTSGYGDHYVYVKIKIPTYVILFSFKTVLNGRLF
jgi:DnaJ homolog subfamily A member 3